MSLLEPLLPLLVQDDLPRTGWILSGVVPAESVAGHVLGVAQMVLALAPRVTPPLDLGRSLAMALVHDAGEVRSGDLPRAAGAALPKGAKAAMDQRLAEAVLAPLGPLALAAADEFRAQTTREARFVKLCDRLQLGVRLVGYVRAGRGGLAPFRAGLAVLDVAEFPVCAELLVEVLAATAAIGPPTPGDDAGTRGGTTGSAGERP